MTYTYDLPAILPERNRVMQKGHVALIDLRSMNHQTQDDLYRVGQFIMSQTEQHIV